MPTNDSEARRAAMILMGGIGLSAALPADAKPKKSLPQEAVIRISRGKFDPARYAEVDAMIRATGKYLVPAIEALPGLISYYAGTSTEGFTTQVSIWASESAGKQMSTLPEMRDRARKEAEALGVVFDPIIQYPISWTVAV
jgi:hypothetical protein